MHISSYKTTSDFWPMLKPSFRTILGSVFVKCSSYLKPCCNYVFQVFLLSISKKEKDECDFLPAVFAFINSG